MSFYTLYIDIRNFQYFVFFLALLHVAKLFSSFRQLVKLSQIDREIIKCKHVSPSCTNYVAAFKSLLLVYHILKVTIKIVI